MRKALPTLGNEMVDVRVKYEEDFEVRERLEATSCNIRERLIEEGKRDEMLLR